MDAIEYLVVAAADFGTVQTAIDAQHKFPSKRMCAQRANGFKLASGAILVQTEAFSKFDGLAVPILALHDTYVGTVLAFAGVGENVLYRAACWPVNRTHAGLG